MPNYSGFRLEMMLQLPDIIGLFSEIINYG